MANGDGLSGAARHVRAQSPEPTQVLVVAGAPVVRDGVATLLTSAGYRVVGRAAGAGEAVRLADTPTPLVVVANARLPGVTSLLMTAVLRRRRPRARVVLVDHDMTRAALRAAACAGVAAVLGRDADAATLGAVVAQVARGETPILARLTADTDVARIVMRLLYAPVDAALGAHGEAPSPSELVALDWLARGLASQSPGRWLGLQPRTLRHSLDRVRVRHGLHSRTQLLRLAVAQGWIEGAAPAVASAATANAAY